MKCEILCNPIMLTLSGHFWGEASIFQHNFCGHHKCVTISQTCPIAARPLLSKICCSFLGFVGVLLVCWWLLFLLFFFFLGGGGGWRVHDWLFLWLFLLYGDWEINSKNTSSFLTYILFRFVMSLICCGSFCYLFCRSSNRNSSNFLLFVLQIFW